MSLDFDHVDEPACEIDASIDPTTCSVNPPVPPSDDERCIDPAFADANPDICRGFPRLILKPSYALTEPQGQIQYKTYLRTGAQEIEITEGLAYSVGNPNIGGIEITTGLFTGTSPGITPVTVTWQNLHASAQAEVVEECADVNCNFLILIDNSESANVAFSSKYSTRLIYAKEAAKQFAQTVNYSRDRVSVAYFNSSPTRVLNLSSDKAAVLAAINGIGTTTQKTNIADALEDSIDYLNDEDPRRVIILFSDGENNQGDDPVPIANAWKSQNNTIIVLALRAWGEWFDMLYRVASSGYFLSSYPATDDETGTEDENIQTLAEFKSYFCSGDCHPEPGTYPRAAINYTGFVNWDVFKGQVDLHGLGEWDYQPGHGLYVDLSGKTPFDPVIEAGGLKSKTSFNFVSGKTYRFKIKVAGNNAGTIEIESVRVRIIKADGTTFLDETITPTSPTMPFTEYTFNFTPATGTAWIQIEMIETVNNNIGPLIDDVILENVTDAVSMLSDDFNNENLTTIPPGYEYYGGCIETPPGAQQADPSPPSLFVE